MEEEKMRPPTTKFIKRIIGSAVSDEDWRKILALNLPKKTRELLLMLEKSDNEPFSEEAYKGIGIDWLVPIYLSHINLPFRKASLPYRILAVTQAETPGNRPAPTSGRRHVRLYTVEVGERPRRPRQPRRR